jgi:hypothetical protein
MVNFSAMCMGSSPSQLTSPVLGCHNKGTIVRIRRKFKLLSAVARIRGKTQTYLCCYHNMGETSTILCCSLDKGKTPNYLLLLAYEGDK